MNPQKILIIEDEPKVSLFIKMGLEENHFVADIAYDGKRGKEMLFKGNYDLLILDLNLPIMSGYNVCKEAREKNVAIPILMLTALGTTEDKLNGFEIGADDYLVKPFSAKELLSRIKAQIKIVKLRQSLEGNVRNLFMEAPALICVFRGPQHVYELANEKYLKLIGNKDILGKPVREALPEANGTEIFELLDSVYSTGEPFIGNELPMRLDRGNGRWEETYFNFVYQPSHNSEGKIDGILAHGVDVTEQVITRKKIEESEKQLEQKVIQRTEQLEEKNAELQKMNKELETFTYISSHDLQEPLRKIHDFVSLIHNKENENLSEQGKYYLQRTSETAKRMRVLIDDLLAYSRTNSAERNFEKTDLNKMAEEVIADFKETLEEKKAVIKADGLCEVNIIRFQFRQLIHNLISNSLKFAHTERPLRIIVKSETILNNKLNNNNLLPEILYCHITVSDNGIGFNPQYNERIFEVFQRLHSKEEYSGTGIGLAICKRIVENHNGIITATGKVNEGARFDIYIPL